MLKFTKLHILHDAEDLGKKRTTGVSLHCHTEQSMEMLDFIPHYADRLPIIKFFWRRERKNFMKREGKGIDFSTAYWSPPLPPGMVYGIEKKQIEEAGLAPLVSLTDHDSIAANLEVKESEGDTHAPISLEWTVPFEYGFFHVGVHNLPTDRAQAITEDLLAFTFSGDKEPDKKRLHELFGMLSEMREVLVILNHPLWDIKIVGQERHEILLKNFIKEFGRWIHAFEINGFRSWSENKRVLEMADALGFPIATGGDRHGCKPNTVINLTDTQTFEEFVDEIRIERKSEVVLLPEYKEPLHSRQLQSFSEILSHYPEFEEHRRRWFDRFFFDIGNEKGLVPLSAHGWKRGGPAWLRGAIWTLGFLGGEKMRPVFRLARKRADRVPKKLEDAGFVIPDVEEVMAGLRQSQTSAGTPG
ncbi:MAG TPA: hypothetical protein VMM38_06435 [Aridibacter sp.]|nr:hypothetical protein [Aridibacter sp.]